MLTLGAATKQAAAELKGDSKVHVAQRCLTWYTPKHCLVQLVSSSYCVNIWNAAVGIFSQHVVLFWGFLLWTVMLGPLCSINTSALLFKKGSWESSHDFLSSWPKRCYTNTRSITHTQVDHQAFPPLQSQLFSVWHIFSWLHTFAFNLKFIALSLISRVVIALSLISV